MDGVEFDKQLIDSLNEYSNVCRVTIGFFCNNEVMMPSPKLMDTTQTSLETTCQLKTLENQLRVMLSEHLYV